MNIQQKLEILRESAAQYVCIGGAKIFNNPLLMNQTTAAEPLSLVFLTLNAKLLSQVLGAIEDRSSPVGKRKLPYRYTLALDNNRTYSLRIFEKGNNWMPERFESEVMQSRVLKENIMHTPNEDCEFWAMTYMKLIHQGELGHDLLWRELMLNKLLQRVGQPVPPSYNIPFHPNLKLNVTA